MIDENRIKQEIDNYVNGFELDLLAVEPPIPQKQKASLVMTMHNTLDFGLRRGQEMFLESLWHDACEEPNEDEVIITEYEECAGINYEIGSNDGVYDWRENVKEMNIKRWCYISDLFPKGGEK